MEKTPAASAMDWSIQLEKSLRSRTPGKSIDALKETGKRLQWWNRQSELKAAEYRMFGLIPGEDMLFLNAIFLRLVDSFRCGSKEVKNCVVNIFFGMMKKGSRRRGGEGILSSSKLENYLDFLRRVKEVFDEGDSEERALSLVLFGCWGNLAKDSPDVRYIVLSSLLSHDVLEAKAALFAAGCLSKLSDDFAIVFFEILTTMVISSEISKDTRLAAGRVFAKLCCSSLLADKAYKTGVKLLMDSLEDDFSAVMLVSLSKIASRWMMLIPCQMELVFLFLREDRSLRMQVTSLKCLRFILGREVCNFLSAADTVDRLFGILRRSESPPILQLEALKTLHKVLIFSISTISCMEMPDLFLRLLAVVKDMEHSSIVPTRVFAVSTLADLSEKILARRDVISGVTGSTLAIQLISFILDQILLLVTPKAALPKPGFSPEHEARRLISLLCSLAWKHSYLHSLLLNNICLFIDELMKKLERIQNGSRNGSPNHEFSESVVYTNSRIESKLMLCVSKVLVVLIQCLADTSTETCQILDKLKFQIENVCRCSYFDSYTTTIYSLLLIFCVTHIGMRCMSEEVIFLSRNLNREINSAIQLDEFTIDCAKVMFEKNSYWSSYKAGKIASCQGAWSAAAFIFEQVTAVVKSASTSCWLKCLTQFSSSEKQIQYFFLYDLGHERNLGGTGDSPSKMSCCDIIENLLKACKTIVSAEGLLAVSDIGHVFSFQRWFLILRSKFLKTVIKMMKVLDSSSFLRDGAGPIKQLDGSILIPCTTSSHRLDYLINYSTEISYQMKKLAQEFDLLSTSFMDMATQSRMIVSTLASSCSLIAFATGFAFFRPNLDSSGNGKHFKSGNTENPLHALLIEDLMWRLRPTDIETREKFVLLLKKFPNYKSCYLPHFQTQVPSSYDTKALNRLCAISIKEILTLQNNASQMQVDGGEGAPFAGSQLLKNIISELMYIPFRTPHRFFQVRSSISSELFMMDENGRKVDGISVLPGFHLSLSLCLQVKNIRTDLLGTQRKVYCILNYEKYFHSTGICEAKDHLVGEDQDMVDLNDKLLRYIVYSGEGHCRGQADEHSLLDAYVCFQLNERGQGFANCLLDVSGFHVGCHRIKWHTCFIDSRGSYWSPFPLNSGLLFTVRDVK